MRNKLFTFFILSSILCSFYPLHAQDTVTVDFSDMTPHVGQYLYLRVVNTANDSEVARTSTYITSPTFSLSVVGTMPGNSYDVDFFADLNKNGRYDAPPTDHAWRIMLDSVRGDTTISFVHNTNFTDIMWPHAIMVDFSAMTPHVGEYLYLSLMDITTGMEVERKKMFLTGPDFNVSFIGITPGDSYDLDFFADHNKNGLYDPPPIDHAWRIRLDSVRGDTTISFVHNTNFTDIMWKYELTVDFSAMYPHVGENLYLSLMDKTTGMEVERKKIFLTGPAFNVSFLGIMPGHSYNLDFFADHNKNGLYDPPPTDHAWRIMLDSVRGDTTISFVHNTNFTDIMWKYRLTINFMDMTPHIGQLFKLYLRNPTTGAFIDSVIIDPIDTANFTVHSYAIVPGNSYNIDFFADLNMNGKYDPPPTDHAWRIPLMNVRGDTTINFTHNTNFTDIGLSSGGGNPSGILLIKENLSDAYPNPVINNMTVDLGKLNGNLIHVQIFSTSGRVLMDQKRVVSGDRITLEMGGLQSGVYILKINDGNIIKALRFVKK